MMIGGIEIFLLLNPREEKFHVVDDIAKERKPTETFREEELEQTSQAAQAEEENEHSEEWLNIFQPGS